MNCSRSQESDHFSLQRAHVGDRGRKKNPRKGKPIEFGGKGENQMPEAGKKVPGIHLQGP